MNRNFWYCLRGSNNTSKRKVLVTSLGALALPLLIALTAFRAQPAPRPQGPSAWNGIYTNEQAGRGEAVFQRECSRCHGQQLEGLAEAPALAGPEFLSKWNGLGVGDLLERIRTTMPQDNPGKLTNQQYADIIAFFLKANGFPAGQNELSTSAEMLKQVPIEQFNPHPPDTPAPAPRAANPPAQGQGGGAPQAPPLTMTSTAFTDGAMVPTQYTCSAKPAPVTPPLAWTNVPKDTASFAMILHDMEPRPRKGVDDNLHWMIWNIPGTATSLPENVPAASAELPDGSRQSRGSTTGAPGYGGPCPPQNVALVHHYAFELFALDQKLNVPTGASRADVLKAMDGHVIGHAVLMTVFHR